MWITLRYAPSYPHTNSPHYQDKERRKRKAQTVTAMATWVTHKQPPPDLYASQILRRLHVDNPRKGDMNCSKEVRIIVIGNKPFTQSCHFAIGVEEEIR
jgi:hypothetical protein